jgi:hypothetical protein
MHRANLVLMLGLLAPLAHGGAIATQFSSGYGGVYWGTSLDSLVGVLPGGEHHFSTSPGERAYIVKNSDPFFGVPRSGMNIVYHMGKGDVVEGIEIAFPYERRDQLLGVLLSLFGAYTQMVVNQGLAVIYRWPHDNGITVTVRTSTNPTNGILEFGVARWSSAQKASQTR